MPRVTFPKMHQQDSQLKRITEVISPEIDKFVNTSVKQIEGLRPRSAFHFTSEVGLNSILANQELWLSHVLDMEDQQEFSHGVRLFVDALDRVERLGVDKAWLDLIRNFLVGQGSDPAGAPFVLCTTNTMIAPVHWQTYGSKGLGAVLELDPDLFVGNSIQVGGPTQIVYSLAQQSTIVSQMVD